MNVVYLEERTYGEIVFQFLRYPFVVQKISIDISRLGEDLLKHVRDVVCANNAAVSPDLDDFCEVDTPFVLLICLVDDLVHLCQLKLTSFGK